MPNGLGRPWRRTVAYVIRRDGGYCHICGLPGADTADHDPVPRSQGAGNSPQFLKAAHHNQGPRCNRYKGDRTTAATLLRMADLGVLERDFVEHRLSTLGLVTSAADDWDW